MTAKESHKKLVLASVGYILFFISGVVIPALLYLIALLLKATYPPDTAGAAMGFFIVPLFMFISIIIVFSAVVISLVSTKLDLIALSVYAIIYAGYISLIIFRNLTMQWLLPVAIVYMIIIILLSLNWFLYLLRISKKEKLDA